MSDFTLSPQIINPALGSASAQDVGSSVDSWQPPRIVSLYATLAGMTGLLPIPFVDEWLYNKVRRRMLRALLERPGHPMPDDWLQHMEGPSPSLFDMVGSSVKRSSKKVALKLFFFPLRKLMRKVLYFLAIRDCLHRSTQIFCEGYMMQEAKDAGYLSYDRAISVEQLQLLHASMRQALETTDLQPTRSMIRRMFSSSWGLLSQIALALWYKNETPNKTKKSTDLEQSQRLGTFITRLQDELRQNDIFATWFQQFTSLLWGKREDLSLLAENFHAAYHDLSTSNGYHRTVAASR